MNVTYKASIRFLTKAVKISRKYFWFVIWLNPLQDLYLKLNRKTAIACLMDQMKQQHSHNNNNNGRWERQSMEHQKMSQSNMNSESIYLTLSNLQAMYCTWTPLMQSLHFCKVILIQQSHHKKNFPIHLVYYLRYPKEVEKVLFKLHKTNITYML